MPHLLLPDFLPLESALQEDTDIWNIEDGQTRKGVSAVKYWANSTGLLGDDDVLISADVDEVLSQDALHHLRHCHLASPVVHGAIYMPFGNLSVAYR